MSDLTSIEQLIDCFENSNPSEQISILKKLNIPKSEFEKFAIWKKGEYTRNCLARKESFELILICWDVGAKTPIHNHGGQDCWVYQISESVIEKRFSQADPTFKSQSSIILNEGKITYMHDRMGYHFIENISNNKAMTLHIYANPIDSCQVFNEKENRFETKELKYDSMMENTVI